MRTRYKLAILVAFQPIITVFDRFMYAFFYVNGFSLVQIAIIEILYASMATITLFAIGNYADVKGRKRLVPMLIGYASLFPLFYVRFKNFISAALIRFFDGAKHAHWSVYSSITQDLSPKKRIGMYFGIVTAILGISSLAVSIVGGLIIDLFGFEMLALVTTISIIIFCIFFKKGFPETKTESDGVHKRPSFRIIKNRFILAYAVYQFIFVYTFITSWVYLPIKSFDVMSNFVGVGLVMFAGQVVLAFGQVPFGMLADKLGIFKVYAFGMVFSSITSFLLGFVHQGVLLIVVNLLVGVAASLTAPAEQALVSDNIPKNRRVEFNNLIQIARELGVIFSMIVASIMVLFFNIDYIFYMQSAVFIMAPVAFFATYKIGSKRSSSLSH
jgi:MFS family permease